MSAKDIVLPFIFESLPVRGAFVQLESSWQRLRRSHNYDGPVTEILGHAAAATLLIAQSLKFEGSVTLQTNSDGPLSLLVMQSTHELDFRGMATSTGATANASYAELLGGARCAVTVDAGAMERPYQGIVEMSPQSLGASLENYFSRSVQLASHLQLRSNKSCCGGILLQQMPEKTPITDDDWRRLGFLIETLNIDELGAGATPELLHKLFAEDDVRVFQPRATQFKCRCSKAKVEDVLRFLGEEETRSACEEKGIVEVTCEFCGRTRSFDAVDVSRVFADLPMDGSDAVH
jgi:molecular chaperone Hsp33